jgi:ABC-type lipopolysaccharide export system ATPase subunit
MTAQLPLLVIEDLHSAYGLSRVLFGISLQVAAGECVCLLGRNGVVKNDDDAFGNGLLAADRRPNLLEGYQYRRLGSTPSGVRWHRLRAGRPPHFL